MANPAPPSSSRPGSCACGFVIFDLAGRTVGEELTCSWCGKRYRFTGGENIEPLIAGAPVRPNTQQPARAPGRPAAKRPDGPPGGVMPMIVFMIVFNAAALGAVSYIFQKSPADDLRHAIWDPSFVLPHKSIWPEVVALLVGNFFGFTAWALYAYRIHKRELAERSAK